MKNYKEVVETNASKKNDAYFCQYQAHKEFKLDILDYKSLLNRFQ